jgi:hypothetical protein
MIHPDIRFALGRQRQKTLLAEAETARSGVVQLRRWRLLGPVLDSGAPAIRQVTFHAGGESVSRAIKHKAGVDLVVAPRRYVLDTITAAAAGRAGAGVRLGVPVTIEVNTP